jgi:hypothetical protein
MGGIFKKVPKEVLLKYRYPDPLLKEQYKVLNWVLIGIVGIAIIFRIINFCLIFSLYSMGISKSIIGISFLLNIIILILMIWLITILFHFDARAYITLITLCLISYMVLDPLNIILTTVILILSLMLKKKLFPNIPIFGYIPKE